MLMNYFILVIPLLSLFCTAEAGITEQLNSTSPMCNVCGSSPAYVDIATACSRYSGWSQDCCQCIVRRESGGNLHACNLNVGGTIDAGLWQINSNNWIACNGGSPPCDIQNNLNCAIKVFNWGSSTWRFWSTCGACGCCTKR